MQPRQAAGLLPPGVVLRAGKDAARRRMYSPDNTLPMMKGNRPVRPSEGMFSILKGA
ncbi:MAG: hypothetical protein K2Z80_32265 [Xanthobacteraceae bacterium]|nr:hypothetical protein [Xanthobacteraceae bacterium]